MNFLEIANYIQDQQDGDRLSTVYASDLGTLPQATRRVRDNINWALTLVKLALGWRNEYAETTFTLTTVAGQETVAIPAGILSVEELKNGNDYPLPLVPWMEYQRQKSSTLLATESGSPDMASVYGRHLYFFPTPDAAYTLSGRGKETLTRLNQDTDSPDLPDEMHQVVADFALYKEMAYEGNPAAGVLVIQENGSMNAQGGQAAHALLLFRVARNNLRSHLEQAPRMMGVAEMKWNQMARRIVRG